jgi:hypothetical protein
VVPSSFQGLLAYFLQNELTVIALFIGGGMTMLGYNVARHGAFNNYSTYRMTNIGMTSFSQQDSALMVLGHVSQL